jgi:hypothetical protein
VRTFHATAVEVLSEYDTRTVHFDDEKDQYLQLQTPESKADALDWEDGSGFNCFSEAELRRDRFRIVFARDPHMTRLGGVEVTFDLDDASFADLRKGLEFVFRNYLAFRVVA